METRLNIFICYAREDEELRKILEKQLKNLNRQGLIDVWHDREISAGTEWEEAIHQRLDEAHIILLLISPDFIASDYSYDKEMTRAMERHEAGEARVIPILLRPSDWEETPFGKLQFLPTDAVPVTRWSNHDDAFLNVAKGIRKTVQELRIKFAEQEKLALEKVALQKAAQEQLLRDRAAEVQAIEGQAAQKDMDYLDFEIEIGAGTGRDYSVAIVNAAAGEVREQMHFPFDELALENQLLTLQNALLRSGGKRRQILIPEEQAVQGFGLALFNALLTGEVRNRFILSQRAAFDHGKGLRLKLRIQAPELAVLPWEFLYDPAMAEYVCLSSNTPVVRYLDLPQNPQPLAVTLPLSILGMTASPGGLAQIDVDREKQRVERAIKGLQAPGLVKLTWLEGQTWQDLQRVMRRGPWHIFHFIGHGGFDANTEEGLISLENEEGQVHLLRATQLGRLLADHRSLRLVILNACEGARGSGRDIFSSTAAILVRRGIPAVLAMQYEITDQAAIVFSRAFYEAIADGMPVDAAVSDARKAISIGIDNSFEWGTPVLYMRSPDGVLFDLVQSPSLSQMEIPSSPQTDTSKEENAPSSAPPTPVTREAAPIDQVQSSRTVTISKTNEFKLIRTLEVGGFGANFVRSVAVSPDGQTLVSTQNDRTIKVWNLHTGELLRTLRGHSTAMFTYIPTIAISPDGQTIASGSDDKTIKVWNLHTGELLRTLTGHSGSVRSVAIGPDGQTIASSSHDETIKVWNLHTAELLNTLTGHSNTVYSVAFSPDGQALASGSADQTIKIWGKQ